VTVVQDCSKHPILQGYGGHYGTSLSAASAWEGQMIMWSSPYACKVQYKLYFSSVVNLAQVTCEYDAGATVSVWGQGRNGPDRIQLGATSCYDSNGGSINTCTVPTGHSSGTTFYVVIDSHHSTWNWMGNFVATTSPPPPSP
jgi:hypothetical protein